MIMTSLRFQLMACVSVTCVMLGAIELRDSMAQPGHDQASLPMQGSFLSFQQAVDTGLKNHPFMQEGNANLKANEARTEQARSLYYPQVSANFDSEIGRAHV